MRKENSMEVNPVRRLALIIGAVGALMLGIAAPASAAPSNPPSCYGLEGAEAASSSPQAVGSFVRHYATEVFTPPETSIGQTGVPTLKAICGS
jgi:hypothetical protein